jgi:hypothetical protein
MKRLGSVVGVAVLVLGGLAVPASAAGKDEAPAQVCKALDNTWEFPGDDRPFEFTIQSDGGCASSVAQGFPDSWVLSGSAFISQCKFLEDLGVVSYPYAFYGNPDYVAKNRADCKYFLSSFHFGLLPPGPGGG